LGLSSYAFTWAIGVPGYPVETPMTPLQLLEKAAQLGVACVQIADNMPLHALSDGELSLLKNAADEKNIAVEVGMRGLLPDQLGIYMDLAVEFDSPILRVVIDAANFEPSIADIIYRLHQTVPELEKRNLALVIENHDRFKAREFVEILQAVNSDRVGICLDSVNSMGAGEGVERVTETLGEYTLNLHIKEFIVTRIDHKMGFKIEGRPAGQGMLPLAWMLSKLNPRCNSAILEQWVPPEASMADTIVKEDDWARQSITYLQHYFA